MRKLQQRWITLQILAFAGLAATFLLGGLEPVERELIDLRFRLLTRPPTGDLALVRIDSESLTRLGAWPWPRGRHGELLDRLVAAGATDIAFDIDFSAPSTADEDARFAAALVRSDGRAVLAMFRQHAAPTDRQEVVPTRPLAAFARHARLASANVRPDGDGVVRQMFLADRWDDGTVPTLAALLSGASAAPGQAFHVDYGIRVEELPQLSYAAVLRGNFDPAVVAGRKVIVGATAIELGDTLAVPVWSALPGSFVQAAATQSIAQDRMLQRPPATVTLALALAAMLALGAGLRRCSWRRGFVATAAAIVAIAAAGLAAQSWWPLLPDLAPPALGALLAFGAALACRTDEQSRRLQQQGVALRRQDAFMRQIVDNSFDGLVTTDIDGRILSVNPSAQRTLGRSDAELGGRPLGDFLRVDGVGEHGTAGLLAGLAAVGHPREVQGRRSGNLDIPLEIAVTAMRHEAESLFIVAMRDISARRLAESQAALAQQRLLEAIESISEAFVLYDRLDHIVLCNSKFRELHQAAGDLLGAGWRFEDIMRAYAAQGMVPEAEGETESWVYRQMAAHRNPQQPREFELADGRWLRISERQTRDGGIVGIISDVTDAKRREQALRRAKDDADLANRGKTAFLANMSHELRTPLNAIMGFTEIMRDELLGPIGIKAYVGYMQDIHVSATHLLHIINEILDLSKVAAGKTVLKEEELDVSDAVNACIRLIAERAQRGGLHLAIEIEDDLPRLRADERLLKQMLLNLLSNAIKFTPEGGVVRIATSQDGDGGILIAVIDSGVGIDEALIPRVLEPFGQVDATVSRQQDGTGLGLPITNSFVELHGGRFELRSTVGVGTTAVIRFPPERTVATPAEARPSATVYALPTRPRAGE